VSSRLVDLSIVLPVFNETQSLPILWEELQEVLKTVEDSAEVIVVDDGSTDTSVEFVRLLQLRDSRVRLIRLAANRGLSSALAAGMCAVRGRVVVTLDSDLQSDPRDIPLLLAQLDRWDAAVGWRPTRRDPWLKRVSSRIANRVRGAVLGDRIRDSACSLRAMHRRCLDSLPFFDGFHRFIPALLRQAGHRVIVVPVNHRPRRFGVSHYGVRNRAWRGGCATRPARSRRGGRDAGRRSRPPGRDIDDVRIRQEVGHRVTPHLETRRP
jgi:glycosyltransferase involved in cell wall biosynthesis